MTPEKLKSLGRRLPRKRHQRPNVKPWKGKSGRKYWKVEYHVYIEGRLKPKHKSKTWLCSEFTKSEAQAAADKLVRLETDGYTRPDGSLTVSEYWDHVYWPMQERRVAKNTALSYASVWNIHIQPAIGKVELQLVTKQAIAKLIDGMADKGLGKQSLHNALVVINGIFAEAIENGYVVRNPAHNVTLPRLKPPNPTKSLTVDEVKALLDGTEGRDRLIWRVLILAGLRIGELLALKKSDLVPAGLCIDETAVRTELGETKSRKIRYVPIPDSLRRELEVVAKKADDLLFPSEHGGVMDRVGYEAVAILNRGRKIVPALTFRRCRTTLATLYDGEAQDVQGILGHGSVDITMGVYRKPQAERQQAAVENLDSLLRGKITEISRKLKEVG